MCADIDECRDNPCHRSAQCQNSVGSFVCVCPEGQVGDAYASGCRRPDQCISDNDCPTTAICSSGKCHNPCENQKACGTGAQCQTVNHKVKCFCPPRTSGNPNVRCVELECVEHSDCAPDKSCVGNQCKNPCSIPGVCGKNADCRPEFHLHTCTCKAGFTGDAKLGCTSIAYCSSELDCPSGEQCNGGVCVRKYQFFCY